MPAFANVHNSTISGNTINDVVGSQVNNYNDDNRSNYGNTTSFGATGSHNKDSRKDRSRGTTNYTNSGGGTFNNYRGSSQSQQYEDNAYQPNRGPIPPNNFHARSPATFPVNNVDMDYWTKYAAQFGVNLSIPPMPNNPNPNPYGSNVNDPRAPIAQAPTPQFKSNNPFRQNPPNPPSREYSNPLPSGNAPYYNNNSAAHAQRPSVHHTQTAPAMYSTDESSDTEEESDQARHDAFSAAFADLGADITSDPAAATDPRRPLELPRPGSRTR